MQRVLGFADLYERSGPPLQGPRGDSFQAIERRSNTSHPRPPWASFRNCTRTTNTKIRSITVNEKNLEASSEFVRVAGLRFDEIGGERVRGSIELGERHHTPWGVVHGGVYTTAVESAASVGASTAVEETKQFAVGVSNSTDFLRPVREGRVDVVAEPIMQGKIQQLWQVVITRSEDGKEVARGQVRLQNVPLPS
jgi:1,4-dihydroxy-2-naphthoyl-CoA hydrolase